MFYNVLCPFPDQESIVKDSNISVADAGGCKVQSILKSCTTTLNMVAGATQQVHNRISQLKFDICPKLTATNLTWSLNFTNFKKDQKAPGSFPRQGKGETEEKRSGQHFI